MMEKAIKQRLVGGLVLIAGAALFLPMVLDGSGSDLVVPPMPQPPKVANVEDIQPHLESEIAAASASVDAAQAGPVFHEVVPAATASAVEDVAPDDAYALAQAPAQAATAATATATAVIAPSVADKQAQARLATDKAAAAEADRAAAKKAEADRLAREKIEKERLEAGKKAQEAKQKVAQLQAAAKPVAVAPVKAPAKPAANLPEAWVVQVASLSARDKADELVTRLRAKGFRATVVHQSGNWKVLVGPELRKEVAESIKQRLATDPELKLSGWVQAWKP